MKTPARPIRLHRHPLSGHAHRVEMFLGMLGLPFETIDVDLVRGEQKSPAFLALNPFGEVPVIEDGDAVVPDSNAILVYLAAKYDESGRWMPADPLAAARVQRWLSVAAGRLAFGPATARVNALFGRPDDPRPREIADALLAQMDSHLATSTFLAGEAATIADLAMYTYTSHAPEGGVSLEPWKHVRRWLEDVEALPRFRGMMRIGDAMRETA
jgi:glutathione S-transferase